MILDRKLSLRGKALRLLARREYSRAQLEAKLWEWLEKKNQAQTEMRAQRMGQKHQTCEEYGNDATTQAEQVQEVALVLDELQAKGWMSDERFVESLLHQKSYRLGANRLQQELRSKGIDEQLVQNALQDLKGSEFERACEVWQRKFKELPVDASNHNKQARFLLYRGFNFDVVRKVLAGGWEEQ